MAAVTLARGPTDSTNDVTNVWDKENRLNVSKNSKFEYRYWYNAWSEVQGQDIKYELDATPILKQLLLTYDQYGRLTRLTYPDTPAASTVDYTYDIASLGDNFDRLRSVTPSWGGTVSAMAHDSFDRLTGYTAGTSPTSPVVYGYDAYSRVTSINIASGLRSWTYEWYKNGNLKTDGTETHSYDKVGRLTSTTGSSQWGALSWTHDLAGNRNSSNDAGCAVTYNYPANDNGQASLTAVPGCIPGVTLQGAWSHDFNGRTTRGDAPSGTRETNLRAGAQVNSPALVWTTLQPVGEADFHVNHGGCARGEQGARAGLSLAGRASTEGQRRVRECGRPPARNCRRIQTGP